MSLLSFMLVCLIVEATPGPNMAYLVILSALKGRRAGFAAVCGVALGLLVVGGVAALGVAALIAGSPLAYHVLRWAGVAYLLYLAWEAWRDSSRTDAHNLVAQVSNKSFFMRGFLINVLNPKAAVFYVAIVPGFIVPEGSVAGQALLLTVIYVVIATCVHGAIVALAGSAQRHLQDQRKRRLAQKASAIALLLVAVWFAVITRTGML